MCKSYWSVEDCKLQSLCIDLVTLNFLSPQSLRVEEEKDLPPNYMYSLQDHCDSDDNDDESDISEDDFTIESINDEDIQQIHIGGHTASVQVRLSFYAP